MRNPIYAFLTLSLLFFVSCSKERPEELVQGSPENLESISEYRGKILELKTGSNLLTGRIQSTTENVNISKDVKNLNTFKFVEFKIATDLLDGVPFRGRPNTSYKILFELTADKMILHKVAKKDDIPFLEMTSAVLIESGELKGLYSVPLVYYPINLYRLENVKDGNGNNTQKLNTYSTKSPSSATHITYLREDKVRIKLDKPDVFPSDLLNGEWFYAATIVSTNFKNANSVGRDLSVDFEAASVSRIKFVSLKDELRGVNLNVDQNIDQKDHINLDAALIIPVKRLDFSRDKIGSYLNPEETKYDEENDQSVSWKNRKYMKIDFASVGSILTDNEQGDVTNLEIDKDYISFTVYYEKEQIRIKYALRKAHKPLKGRVYHSTDRTKFGFFKTRRHFIQNYTTHREEDFEKNIFLNRFYPENGKILYYFSHSTPKRFYQSGVRAIQAWNDAFKKAGSDITIEIGKVLKNDVMEYKTVSLGDIRYNILNIMETKNGASLLGYGPSIVDSESGQIISATCNTYINPFREGIISTLRNYIKSKHGILEAKYLDQVNLERINGDLPSKVIAAMSLEKQLKDSNITPKMKEVMNKQLDSYKAAINENTKYFGKMTHNYKLYKQEQTIPSDLYSKFNRNEAFYEYLMKITSKQGEELNYSTKHKNFYKLSNLRDQQFGEKCSFARTKSDALKNIEKKCPEFVKYTLELKERGVTFDENEIEQLYACSEKLIDDHVVSTIVHEVGHNLGLRHNFAGSSDPDNFTRAEDKKILAKTSSIMDYPINDVKELLEPGRYDIAAISFGYTNSIELEGNDERVAIPNGQSINHFLQSSNKSRREYRFCTDQDASFIDSIDPLCKQWDYGSNPEEVVDTIIDRFNSRYATYAHKYDRAGNPSEARYLNLLIENTFFPLKKIYDQWRYHFASYLNDKDQYLDSFGMEDFKEKVASMSNDNGRHGKNHKLYYRASQKIYLFLSKLFSSPVKYCLAKPANGPYQTIPLDFETYRHKVFKEYEVTINNCQHPKLADLLSMETPSKELLAKDIGNFFNTINKNKNIANRDAYETNIVLGLKDARDWAFRILTARLPLMKQLRDSSFLPSMMDNPLYRQEIGNKVINRILNGVSASNFQAEDIQRPLPFFALEKSLLVNSYISYVMSGQVPEKFELNGNRMQPFSVGVTNVRQNIPEGAAVTRFVGRYFFATPSSQIGKILIEKREALKKSLQDAKQGITPVTEDEVLAAIEQLSIPSLEELKTLPFPALLELLDGVNSSIDGAQGAMGDALKAILQPYAAFSAALIQAFQAGKITQDDMQKPAYVVITSAMELKDESILIVKEHIISTVKPTMGPLVKEWEQRRLLIDFIKKDQDQYEAQLNLLTEILLKS
ncbi:MAG: hypothetical protein HN509_16725 [Halobacteriovoraceae bacterium]|nr:hypothetical protein [Halobacteriovoraceae bacterium]